MTTPYPSANPGGEHNWLVRNALKDWVDAQHIPGVNDIMLTLQPLSHFEDNSEQNAETGCASVIYIEMGEDAESRAALVGPTNPGGKDINYTVMLHVRHRGFDMDDWEGSQRDYNRIIDRLKDCLRAEGRDLGRPDVILQAADWPRDRGLVHTPSEPVVDNSVVDRWGVLSFQVLQYLPTFVPTP